MPTLHWIGREKVINHHHEVPFKTLQREYVHTTPEEAPANSTGNRIIHGDNLEALKALLPEFEGRIKCIYIDPPYNTGNEEWVYNDNVSDPRIQKWLEKTVGKEGDDLSRHDKWLCMMYPRLKLLHRLLAADGILFVSIDDDEVHTLRMILDEIFGRSQRMASFCWRTDGNFDNQAKIKICHEYVLMYSKNPEQLPYPPVVDPSVPISSKLYRDVIRNTIVKNGPKNPISSVLLPAGFPADFAEGIISARQDAWPHFETDMVIKHRKLENECTVSSGWSSAEIFREFINNGFKPVKDSKGQDTEFVISKTGAIESIKKRGKPSHVISVLSGFGSTQNMSAELAQKGINFSYPKPVDLLAYLVSMVDDKDFWVLDSFAGSGTTAHAVLKLNAQDGGNRRFILTEMMDYAENITAERVRRIMEGYGEGTKKVAGLGGSFEYYTIGASLFDEDGNLNEMAPVEDIRRYVAYTEGVKYCCSEMSPFFIGQSDDAAYLFYYEVDRATALDYDFLNSLHFADGKRPSTMVIYADNCLLSQEQLSQYGIIFKKIPRDISRF